MYFFILSLGVVYFGGGEGGSQPASLARNISLDLMFRSCVGA